MRRLAIAFAGAATLALASPAATPAHELTAEERAWNEPVPPFRVAGNVYYVGAAEVTSYLIVTNDGSVLLDSGFAETVPQIVANIRTLGFDPNAIRYLLISHPHFDHVGGIAELARLSGAKIVVSRADAPQTARGGVGDFAFGDRFSYEPFTANRLVDDGDRVELGDTVLTALVTPGHTRGCTTWTLDTRERGRAMKVAFLCSLTAPGYRLVGNANYPRIADDFRSSLDRLDRLPVDVFLAAHGSFFDLAGKRRKLCANPVENPFVDPAGWKRHLAERRRALEEQIAAQQHGG